MLSIIIVAVALFISGCNSEFFQPPFDDLLTKKPVDTSPDPVLPPPDPISEPIRGLPYHQTDFDFQNEGEGLVVSKVVDSAGNQKTPIIYKNKIAYVTSNHPGTGKDEIYLYDLEKKTNTRLTWRLDDRSQFISSLRLGDDVVVWIEAGKAAYYHDIYIKYLNGNFPEKKIHSFKMEGGPGDGYLPALKILKNYVFWAQPREGETYFKPQIYFHDLVTQKTHEIVGLQSPHFQVENNWIIFLIEEQNKKTLKAYNLITFENNLLYLSWAYDVYVYDLISFKTYHSRCPSGHTVSKNVSVDGDQFTLSYNDTLIRDNDDIFHVKVMRYTIGIK